VSGIQWHRLLGGVVVTQQLEHWTFYQAVAGLTPSLGINSAFYPSGVGKSSISLTGWG